MGWLTVILWIVGISLALYHPISPVATSNLASGIKGIIPDSIDSFFEGIYSPPSSLTAVSQAGIQKLGQVSCQSDNSCVASYPSYKNIKCQSDGFCYGSVY